MTFAAGAATLYILILTVLPEKGQDVRQIFTDINRELSDRDGASIMYKLKINGENTVVAAVNVSHTCILEDIIDRTHQVAKLETTCEPVITYEDFGKALGVSANLTKFISGTLKRENIIVTESLIDYFGNTTEGLMATWKASIEDKLALKQAGDTFAQTFKHVVQRKLNSFTNGPDPAAYDVDVVALPVHRILGSNVHTHVRGAQFLEDYVASRSKADGYY